MANQEAAATGNALERQQPAVENSRRERDDYAELQNAALEKIDPGMRSRHAVLPSKGLFSPSHSVNSLMRSCSARICPITVEEDTGAYDYFFNFRYFPELSPKCQL